MKVIYLDFLIPKGHHNQNQYYISTFSQIGEVIVVTPPGFYDIDEENVLIVEDKHIGMSEGKFSTRMSVLKNMKIANRFVRKYKPDIIFISSYDTFMFPLFYIMNRKRNLFLLHHNNIDELINPYKRKSFNFYMNGVKHVVFEEFIKEKLVRDYGISNSDVFLLPHQLNVNDEGSSDEPVLYDCVGLSNSNDENIISELIEKEKEESIFKKNDLKIVLKSSEVSFDNGALKVIKGFLPVEEYNNYFNQTKSVFMPFPSQFQYRMSGTLVDALSNNKRVISSDIALMQYYKDAYPNICYIFKDGDELVRNLLCNIEDNRYLEEFDRFRSKHSSGNIKKSLLNIINN